jgi:EmrB/QacA subfamily drug resistance transporter
LINPKARPCEAVTIRSIRAASDCAQHAKGWVLAAAVLGSTMAFVDESVVNVALPQIETHLGTDLSAMQWVVNAYTLCMSALLLIGGAAGDQFGRRVVFMTGVAIFTVASLGCGFAPNIDVLVLARGIQGVGAAFLIPCSLAIIGAAFDEKERGAAIGIWSGSSAIAAGVGPLVGGWLVDHTSWRAIFLINPLLAIPTFWIALRHLPESRDPEAPPGLDWRGAILVFTGLGSLVYGLIAASNRGWHDSMVIGSLLTGAVLLMMFVQVERRSHAPMMPLELFRSRSFSGVNLLTLLLYGALGGAFFFLPFLLIQAHGYSATAAGAAFLPFTLILGVLSRWSGGLVDRFGARGPLIAGPAVTGVGFVLLALASANGRYWALLLPMTVLGLGMAMTVAPLTTSVINSVPARQTGVASGINNAVASVASLLLVAVLGPLAIGSFARSLDRHMASVRAPPEVRLVADRARGGFSIPPVPMTLPPKSRQVAQSVVKDSFVETIRHVMLIAAVLAFLGALSAAFMIRSDGKTLADEAPSGKRSRRSAGPAMPDVRRALQ